VNVLPKATRKLGCTLASHALRGVASGHVFEPKLDRGGTWGAFRHGRAGRRCTMDLHQQQERPVGGSGMTSLSGRSVETYHNFHHALRCHPLPGSRHPTAGPPLALSDVWPLAQCHRRAVSDFRQTCIHKSIYVKLLCTDGSLKHMHRSSDASKRRLSAHAHKGS
jgi:hypothetical protein